MKPFELWKDSGGSPNLDQGQENVVRRLQFHLEPRARTRSYVSIIYATFYTRTGEDKGMGKKRERYLYIRVEAAPARTI